MDRLITVKSQSPTLVKYLKLIRWPYLLFLLIGQIFIKYTLFAPFHIPITLNGFGFGLLALATLCLAAAGFVADNLYNSTAMKINRPGVPIVGEAISAKTANRLFFTLNIISIAIGFYLSNIIGHPGFSILFIGGSFLLYANAAFLKKYMMISPLALSLLLGFGLLMVGLYDLFPAITAENGFTETTIFSIVLDYSILIFLINLPRELIVNQINIDGDHKLNRKTLSQVLGKYRTNKVIFFALLLPIIGVIYYIGNYLYYHLATLLYSLILILAPLFYVMVRSLFAKRKEEYRQMNFILQLVLLFSVLSLGLYQFIML